MTCVFGAVTKSLENSKKHQESPKVLETPDVSTESLEIVPLDILL
jgi:hypothetical protein